MNDYVDGMVDWMTLTFGIQSVFSHHILCSMARFTKLRKISKQKMSLLVCNVSEGSQSAENEFQQTNSKNTPIETRRCNQEGS